MLVLRRAILWLAVTSALSHLLACKGDRPHEATTGGTRRAVLPANLSFLSGFDDEGIIERPLPVDSAPGPYALAGEIYADAPSVVAVIAPGTQVTDNAGLLVLDGRSTAIPVRYEGAKLYAPVRALARSLGAYAHTDDTGRQMTLWPSARLCEYRERADRAAPVYQGAEAQGLFAACSKQRRR